MTNKLERLAALGIELVPMPGLERHFVFARDGFASLVERREAGFGRLGTSGLITEHGLAMLIWRQEEPFFVVHKNELPASQEQVEALRQFTSDLERALRAC
ncbi:MAG: hypothetical protein JJE04_24520 [Acidobacteriia bacterium]|nr:hypothetical protein [Terriglobia bacterium]